MESHLRVQKTAKPLLAIGLIVGSLYVFISLISFSRLDPSWNYSSSEVHQIHNWGGIVGSFVSDALIQILGLVSYCLTLLVLLSGVFHLKSKALLVTDGKNQKS